MLQEGNTVLIIEHDSEILSYCDWIIELGPAGGPKGGEIIAEGTPQEIKNNKKSNTGKYLTPWSYQKFKIPFYNLPITVDRKWLKSA